MPRRPGAGAESAILAGLNPQQRRAVSHGDAPLLIVAGAGTGKTKTLVHRVAALIARGVDPRRLLLLTFSRRAAAEMLRRVADLLRRLELAGASAGSVWGGTFHAQASRLLRLHGKAIGLDPGFTIHDRGDSEDLLDVVRTELGLHKTEKRFPKKGTCMAIYSHSVNASRALEDVLARDYPWCRDYAPQLKELFHGYVDRKDKASVLDYDDLLLFWNALLGDAQEGARVRARFDAVLVDEYQDTNRLQAEILKRLCPDGRGLTAVGDDAQSIYSFRAATVRNILDFPLEFPGSSVLKLEQNYRSTQPLLEATNQVIGLARERHAKQLWSKRDGGERPSIVTCNDEHDQTDFLVRRILELREAGLDLRRQAVLFRASHHSILLEAELARHNIPFVKYGGLRFIETAHVKDLMAFLRLAENPRDVVAGTRVLKLLPGIGAARAQRLMQLQAGAAHGYRAWSEARVPPEARKVVARLVRLMERLARAAEAELPAQILAIRRFYGPLLEQRYDNPEARRRDLEQLEQLAMRFASRRAFLNDIALDPPSSTEDLAGAPLQDEDYVILSTIHSAKGLEWDAVYVIHAADGNIPSDMATGDAERVEEERRLFYVALTRARDHLYVLFPLRYYFGSRSGFRPEHAYAQLTRFLPVSVRMAFRCSVAGGAAHDDEPGGGSGADARRIAIRRGLKSLW